MPCAKLGVATKENAEIKVMNFKRGIIIVSCC